MKKLNKEQKPIAGSSPGSVANAVLYAVLKLSTDVTMTNPFTGLREDVKLGGIAGYIPVFSTIEEAEASSQNGKYKILAISPT